MNNYFFILLAFLLAVSIVTAQEATKYNFASAQPQKELIASPGEEIITKIYFFNTVGNRATHVLLSVEEKPADWAVEIKPEVEVVTYDVSGIRNDFEENLVVEPSTFYEKEPINNDEKIVIIKTQEGYAKAREAQIKIEVPKNARVGSEENIIIKGVGFWLGQSKNVDLKQERNFNFKITIQSKDFYEERVDNKNKISGYSIAIESIKNNKSITIIIALIIILGVIIVIKRKNKSRTIYK